MLNLIKLDDMSTAVYKLQTALKTHGYNVICDTATEEILGGSARMPFNFTYHTYSLRG